MRRSGVRFISPAPYKQRKACYQLDSRLLLFVGYVRANVSRFRECATAPAPKPSFEAGYRRACRVDPSRHHHPCALGFRGYQAGYLCAALARHLKRPVRVAWRCSSAALGPAMLHPVARCNASPETVLSVVTAGVTDLALGRVRDGSSQARLGTRFWRQPAGVNCPFHAYGVAYPGGAYCQ